MTAVVELVFEDLATLPANGLTLLKLVSALSRRTESDEQTAQVVLDLVAAERVELAGNFQNSHLGAH